MKQCSFSAGVLRVYHVLLTAIYLEATPAVVAQTPIHQENYIYTFEGDESYKELLIPASTQADFLYLEVKGGDGGKSSKHSGGRGATTRGFFPIGTDSGGIHPGSTLRLIPGKQGRSHEGGTAIGSGSGAGGGGGSGVVLLPEGKTNWDKERIVLMVAGGGGGAGSHSGGRPGDTRKRGSGGNTSGGSELENYGEINMPGQATEDASGGASMDRNAAVPTESSKCGSDLHGAYKGWPLGGTGCPCMMHGGFGFGGGGSGNEAGGGGGGYSGGGGGQADLHGGGGGGGGGSYVTGKLGVEQKSITNNGTTSTPHNGYITYELITLNTIKLASAPEKCMDVESPEFNNWDNIQLWDCKSGENSQYWVFDGDQVYLAFNNKKCVDVKDHQTANGTNVRIWDCMDHNEQKWIYDGVTKQLRSFLDLNKCLNDAYGGNPANGTNIMLWDCNDNGGKADQWEVNHAYTISDPRAIHYIVPVKASGLALQSALGAKWGSNVQLWAKDDSPSERWVFDGKQIKFSPSRDLCITLADDNTSNGTNIELRGCSDVAAKQWIYNGMTKQIRSFKDPNKCLAVATSGGEFEKGMNIQIMDCNQHSRQKFNLKVSTL